MQKVKLCVYKHRFLLAGLIWPGPSQNFTWNYTLFFVGRRGTCSTQCIMRLSHSNLVHMYAPQQLACPTLRKDGFKRKYYGICICSAHTCLKVGILTMHAFPLQNILRKNMRFLSCLYIVQTTCSLGICAEMQVFPMLA